MSERGKDCLRQVVLEKFETAMPGSVLIHQGGTTVLCAASISTDLPKWMRTDDEPTQGWVSAEYNMMPASTQSRKKRGPDSRGTEIQRLIGRVLRAGVDMSQIPGLSITCDCDVIKADGGTRTASITGAFTALSLALEAAKSQGILAEDKNPIRHPVAAVSVGVINGECYLDLDYELDVQAETDMNVAMALNTEQDELRYIEIQGTAEREPYSRAQLNELLGLAEKGIGELITIQQNFLSS